MKTWRLIAMMADGSSFASEVEWYLLEDGVLKVRTVGLADRVVEGECLGVMTHPIVVGAELEA